MSSPRTERDRRSADDPVPAGDRAAFTRLVRRHQGPLFNFALRQLRSPPLAEEVVQDAFVRVVQNAADFKHEARFTTWLYTIARNLCIDQMRKRALRRHPSLDEPKRAEEGDGPTLGEQTADSKANVERDGVATEISERVARGRRRRCPTSSARSS